MKIPSRGLATFALATTAIVVGSTGSFAADAMVASEQMAGSRLALLLNANLSNATLSVAGPNNFHVSTSSRSGAIALDLAETGPLQDGSYDYQVTASGPDKTTDRSPLDNGRDKKASTSHPVTVSMSGTFQVKNGAIVKPAPAKSEKRDQ